MLATESVRCLTSYTFKDSLTSRRDVREFLISLWEIKESVRSDVSQLQICIKFLLATDKSKICSMMIITDELPNCQ